MCCVFRDVLVQCTVVILSPSCQLRPVWPFSSDLSRLQCVFANRSAALWIFFVFSNNSLQTLDCENPRRSAVSEIFFLAPTIISRSKSLISHFSHLALKNS